MKSKAVTKISLEIRTYKIPIEIVGEEVKEKTLDLTEDMIVRKETKELDRAIDNVSLKIPEISRDVHNYNQRQVKITLELRRDYILKQIVTKS